MFSVNYPTLVVLITLAWCVVRALCAARNKTLRPRREAQLIVVYICLVVVARFTFFPFSKVDGVIQPLVFDAERALPPRINLIPFVNLLDYAVKREAVLNVVGNTAMFLPLGIVWPVCFRQLNTPGKAIAAGAGVSLTIELLQLPFFDRVSDVDDLILNTLGFALGYGLYRLFRPKKKG